MEIATQCLARDLAINTEVADIILTAKLAHAAFSYGPSGGVHISIASPMISDSAELAVAHDLAARQERHAEHLGGGLTAAIDYVASLEPAARVDLRTLALACSIDLIEPRGDQRSPLARGVGAKIADMLGHAPSRHWVPDEAFFKKLPKPNLIEALSEMGHNDPGYVKAKKGDLVPLAVRSAKETGWLPEPMRFIARDEVLEAQAEAA